jgi:hypothetical protein
MFIRMLSDSLDGLSLQTSSVCVEGPNIQSLARCLLERLRNEKASMPWYVAEARHGRRKLHASLNALFIIN